MENKKKRIVFLTATRADFGKLKPLINVIEKSKFFDCFVFVTGMHTLAKYGSTYDEVKKQKYKNVFIYPNQKDANDMDIILANTIKGFSAYINKIKPDMMVIHGDRVEPLAGAIVGSLNNVLVAHVEGGEISGTVDEILRHAISKLSNLHFVANPLAKRRLVQMGEIGSNIFVIGSPDIDIMTSKNLPSIEQVKKRYEIPFEKYSIFIYHPVTNEIKALKKDIKKIVSTLIDSKKNYVVIYPNNDMGSDIILKEYKRLKKDNHFKVFPSLRFEYFLELLRSAEFIIGNSSSGIIEAEVYGTPTINIGTRQKNRTQNKDIINIKADKNEILDAICLAESVKIKKRNNFGRGNSVGKFYKIISKNNFWKCRIQKQFLDLINF
jgi:UDP-N-acetylglucosamine 2-epimerase (hydrolysing)